jgi:fibronectin type 3 domain-containing protein
MKRSALIFCIWLCCHGAVLAQETTEPDVDGGLTLSWDPNTEADLDGYRLYVGKSATNYDTLIDIGNVIGYTVSGLTVGETYYFALTAYDSWGNESDYSEEVSGKAKDIIVPKKPEGLKEVTTNVNNLKKELL